MSKKTIFKRIIDGEIPADIIYEDELCLAFRDVAPQAPFHALLIPRKEVRSLSDIDESDKPLLGHLMLVIREIASQNRLEEGYRVVINTGQKGGQTVDHLHFHILAQRQLEWPPG